MPGRIDVHSHLLPEVDDGCDSVEESLECARQMVQAGYDTSFVTPHIVLELPEVTIESIVEWTAELQAELDAAKIPLRLIGGGEINLNPDTMRTPPERLITYGMARRHVLIDFWAHRLPDFFEPSIRWFQKLGLTVILAHPERVHAIQAKPALADDFAKMGVLLQGNLQCLSDPPSAPTRQLIERWLREGRYYLLGSDLHRLVTLPERIAGLRRAQELIGVEELDRLTIEHARRLLPPG